MIGLPEPAVCAGASAGRSSLATSGFGAAGRSAAVLDLGRGFAAGF